MTRPVWCWSLLLSLPVSMPASLAAMAIPLRSVPAARRNSVLRVASVSDAEGGKNGIGPSSRENNPRNQLNSTAPAAATINFCVLLPGHLECGDEASRDPNILPCSGRIESSSLA